jgi:hypothetical protein
MQQRRRPSQAVVDTNVSVEAVAKAARGTVTLREYMAYYLMERQGQANPLHRAGALFQEWTVIQWAKVEEHSSLFSCWEPICINGRNAGFMRGTNKWKECRLFYCLFFLPFPTIQTIGRNFSVVGQIQQNMLCIV